MTDLNEQSEVRLEPCWCHSKTNSLSVRANMDHGNFACRERGRYVYCSNCWAHGPTFTTEPEAIDGWNKSRASVAAPQEDVNLSFALPVRVEGWHRSLTAGGWYIRDANSRIILEVVFDADEETAGRPINGGNPTARTVVALINAATSVSAPVGTGEHHCPHCGRRMKSDFDEDVGMWYECEICDYREQVSNVAATSTTPVDTDEHHTKEELYEHRHALFIALLKSHRDLAWCSRLHDDGTMYDGWFIAGMNLPTGAISYHLPLSYFGELDDIVILERAPKWDGYTPADVIQRLLQYEPTAATPPAVTEAGEQEPRGDAPYGYHGEDPAPFGPDEADVLAVDAVAQNLAGAICYGAHDGQRQRVYDLLIQFADEIKRGAIEP